MLKQFLYFVLGVVLLTSCNSLTTFTRKTPPHDGYVQSLHNVALDKTAMGQAWIQAGERALQDSIIVPLPFSESGYFNAGQPSARSYRFGAREGQVLTINGTVQSKKQARFFLDVFEWKENNWMPIAQGDSTLSVTHEFTTDVPCLVRLQPELLVTAYYTVTISLTPVLINPVEGATNKSIGSFYGDQRDGGARKHEGVDIVARKGTHVIAPADGYITRLGNGGLGGKVVWMQDTKRHHSYYFAHLDSQAVKPTMRVHKGDLIGTVGNTGNARTTPSHLHFGIYQTRSKDPLEYIKMSDPVTAASPWDTTVTQPNFKVIARVAALRMGPSEKQPVVSALNKDTYLQVIAQSNNWYRVLLPNDKQGFILKNKTAPIQHGKRMHIRQTSVLLAETGEPATPILYLSKGTSVEVLAGFENYRYIRTKEGVLGWIIM